MDKSRKYNKSKGDFAEKMAARFLSERGYQIIAANYRKPTGEIDLIAREGETLVFVEVKFRSGADYGIPAEAVGHKKRYRIVKTSLMYLQETDGFDQDIRYDIVEVRGDGSIEIFRGAFTAEGIF